jgi:GNAT superfamily N-acetyltransferase
VAVVSVALRDAALDDLPGLRAVFRRSSLSNAGDRSNLLAHPEVLEYSDVWVRQGQTRVATCDGGVVGFATAVPCEAALEVEDLFVDPDWMRQGVGRALMRDIATRARAGSVRRVDVTANPHALDFYRAVGFVVDGVEETRFGPASRMHLDVAP